MQAGDIGSPAAPSIPVWALKALRPKGFENCLSGGFSQGRRFCLLPRSGHVPELPFLDDQKKVPIMSVFSSRLRNLRKLNRLRQEDLANLCKIPCSTYRRYETDAGEPTLSTAVTMATVLGVALDYLVGRTDSPTPGAPPAPPPSQAEITLNKIRALLEDAEKDPL